jgi:hypothetical protein
VPDYDGLFKSISTPALFGVGAFVLLVGWIAWGLCRKIVRFGFFVLTFLIGFALAYAANAAFIGPPSLPVVAGEAMAFAWLGSMIRSKVAKAVSMVALIIFARALTTFVPSLMAAGKSESKDATQVEKTKVGKQPGKHPQKEKGGHKAAAHPS